ncbi:hypothetical protein BJF80_14610 [Serinicoccus sp. CUA-874]|nr:hypothetical protein BJF80_14610 [Serinicoccus sp. CUA-874]
MPLKEATDSVRFQSGDVLFGKLRPYLAKAWHADRDGTATGELLVMRPGPEVDGRYLTYLALSRAWLEWAGVSAYGAKMPRSSWDAMRDFRLPAFSLDRQRTIAGFLDRETADIDAMIAKQEELVGLLGERRSAVIAHAVTKGLNPNAPLKDSGVEWLGDVPAHWGVKRLSWLFGLISSGTTPANEDQLEDDGDHYWVTTSELRERPIRHTRRMVSSETVEALSPLKLYPPGTLLIAMYGATIGRLGMLEVEACTNQACCAFAEAKGVLPEFAMYALLAAREHLLVLASGGGQPNINQDKLRSLRIPVPPVDEQEALVRHLKEVLDDMDAVVERTQESVGLMRERRAALISDAVTGRLDLDTYGRVEREGVA